MTRPFPDLTNPLKERLKAGQTAFGIFFLSTSTFVAEACGQTSLDWIVFDWEAGAQSRESLLGLMQSYRGSPVSPMIRVPCHDRHLIEHVLDLGADGVIVPKVDNSDQARAVVQSARFPPEGSRGLNPVRASGYFSNVAGYLEGANRRTLLLVQIESAEAIANIEEILAVPGVDGMFIGCGDLAMSLGVPGQMTHPSMEAALKRALDACVHVGKVPGIFAYTLDLARAYLHSGFKFVALGNEIKLLRDAIEKGLEYVKPGSK